ncbi:MAG: ATP-dependent DNA helicase, partial [Nanoarchaeota archaeon]|nr:ATP-dependent DNA helicase [Nanoarchaeota archaeon]
PTGLGKTISALAPALTYSLNKPITIFFLTSRHTQHKIAIETLQIIKQKFKLDFKVSDLIGKRHMCLQPSIELLRSSEFSDYCKDQTEKGLCDYYENTKIKFNVKLLFEKIKDILHVEETKELCKEVKLCPYEISCLYAKDSKIIVCDYNHLLNLSIRGTILQKTKKELENSIIIIDEAHNLPSRIRDNLTVQLSTYTLRQSIKELSSTLGPYITNLQNILEKFSKQIPITEHEIIIKKEAFVEEINKEINYSDLVDTLDKVSEIIMEEKKRCFTKTIANFLQSWLGPNESFSRILTRDFDKKGKVVLTLTYRCLDPSIILKPLSEQCHSLILMSGTLSPTEMYKDLFSINAKCLEYSNPFPVKNKLSLIVPGITTKFTLRNENMYRKIASHCSDVVNNIPGNSIIYFPSYQLREEISNFLNIEKTIITEQKEFTKKEKFEVLGKFEIYKKSGCVLLAISSGNFGESIDLLGDLLKCVVIVGLPLPQPDLEIKELIRYYDLKFKKGWDYGYILPSIIKSFQNAGRCIRSETDKGMIIYLDERYSWPNYYKSFPKGENIKITKEPLKYIKEFFN